MPNARPDSVFSIQTMTDTRVVAVMARTARAFARHTHQDFGIGLLLDGAQRSWSARGTVEAGVGDLITVNPGEVHDGAPIGMSRTWAMFYLAPEKMREITGDIRDGKATEMEFVSPVLRDPATLSRFIAAQAAFQDQDQEAANEQLILLMAGLLQEVSVTPMAMPCLRQVRARIDDAPAARHTLQELADEAGLSRFQLLRSFARYTGLTPHAYVTQRRLDMARSMIRKGARLADAAIDAGFADQSHFHRAFIGRYGLTPRTYANAMR